MTIAQSFKQIMPPTLVVLGAVALLGLELVGLKSCMTDPPKPKPIARDGWVVVSTVVQGKYSPDLVVLRDPQGCYWSSAGGAVSPLMVGDAQRCG